eukprot:GHRR01029461.1.p1 GENE.GHRR01029461.1~~GHRR01029461.1.p1  ORF type:complete len:172 (+),score=31.90 GHRR01029461.1:77-592(+)
MTGMSRANDAVQKALATLNENRTTVAAVATGGAALAGAALLYKRRAQAVLKEGPYPVGTLPADAYDAVIVGAGPSGSVAAHYFAKGGGKVALLDKATFPRGAWTPLARQQLAMQATAINSYDVLRSCNEAYPQLFGGSTPDNGPQVLTDMAMPKAHCQVHLVTHKHCASSG